MFAYAGKILRVNLTTGETKTEPLTEELAKNYIGGIGLGIKLLMDNSVSGADAFDPANPLIYLTGPLSGTMGPTGGNSYAVCLNHQLPVVSVRQSAWLLRSRP